MIMRMQHLYSAQKMPSVVSVQNPSQSLFLVATFMFYHFSLDFSNVYGQ